MTTKEFETMVQTAHERGSATYDDGDGTAVRLWRYDDGRTQVAVAFEDGTTTAEFWPTWDARGVAGYLYRLGIMADWRGLPHGTLIDDAGYGAVYVVEDA